MAIQVNIDNIIVRAPDPSSDMTEFVTEQKESHYSQVSDPLTNTVSMGLFPYRVKASLKD